jgi:hypothetical protein
MSSITSQLSFASLLTNGTSGRDAQGDILWSGGPGQDSGGKAKGAQSYFCLSGKEDPKDLPAGIKSIEARATLPRAPAIACGQYYNTAQQGPFDLLANGAWENLAPGTGMSSIRVDNCGICMVFKERNAQGDTVWSGGPGQTASGSVKDAQSYYCIYGQDSNAAPKLPREDLPTTTLPSGPLSTLPIQPNPTIPPRAPQFPCGSLGTVTKDGKMDYLPTYSDVQYYVPDGSEITWFENEYCAMCAVFKSREEDAEMIWNDWSDEGARGNVIIKGGRSYFCLGQ